MGGQPARGHGRQAPNSETGCCGSNTAIGPRLVVLPADPDTHLVDFDDEFWEWWGTDFADPTIQGTTQWGLNKLPTLNAAVAGICCGGVQGWRRYTAVHRSGAL